MAFDYIGNLARVPELCDAFADWVRGVFFAGGTRQNSETVNYCWTPMYLAKWQEIRFTIRAYEGLGLEYVPDKDWRYVPDCVSSLETPRAIAKLSDFNSDVNLLKLTFHSKRERLSGFANSFDAEEKKRINEAIHVLLEDCVYSCVAMSVSAVESRLLKLMCSASPESVQQLREATLGGLISQYLAAKDKFGNVVPEKHEPLLKLCNTYRILAVHPKKQDVTRRVASSILKLAVEFLIDPETRAITLTV